MRGERPTLLVLAALALVLPAAAAVAVPSRANLELHGGGLAAQAPAEVELPVARVSGSPVRVEARVGPFRVTDTRPGAAGWTLVLTAGSPVDALGRPLGAPLVVEPAPPAVGGAGLVPGARGALDGPRALLVAPPGTGAGVAEVSPLVAVTVPVDAATGVYTTTIVATVS